MGYCGEPVGWVDLESVKQQPNGKLSLWSGVENPSEFIAVPTLVKSLFASVIRSNEEIAAINTVLIAVPKKDKTKVEAITAFLNSKLVKFYFVSRLRSTVIQGYYATVYPRNLEALPWVKNLNPDIEQQLVNSYNTLAQLAATAKNNPDEWLLSEVERQIMTSRYKLSDRILSLNFSNWSPEDVQVEQLNLDGNCIRAGLFVLEMLDPNVAELVYKLLTLNVDEETTISRAIIQKIVIPQNYVTVMQDYRQRLANFQQVESNFFAATAQIDQKVYEMFELTEDEKNHIETRLASFPLNKLQPRYPWQTVKPRQIKAYTSDRFS